MPRGINMRVKKVWETVNKMPTYTEKQKNFTEEEVKRVLLDCTEVNPECPESVRKYGERCKMIGELYYGYKNYMKTAGEKGAKHHEDRGAKQYQVDKRSMDKIERLISYKDEYIG
jgi:hypothetical protein